MTDKNLYSRRYWEGGQPDGSGYKWIGYQNFPAQLIVLDKILERKPESLLDIGGARGYIAKMFTQKTGKPAYCLDISDYCYATRVTAKFILGDITNGEKPLTLPAVDLVFSIAVFEHIKEEDLPVVIKRLSTTAKRGLICPSFVDVGEPDHTHESLKPKEWWEAQFAKYAPGWPVEIVDKEDMERGNVNFQPAKSVKANGQNWTIAGRFADKDIETLSGKNDRPIVLNVSSYVVMWRSTPEICVVNTDLPKLVQEQGLDKFAEGWGYNFTTYEAPGKLPFADSSVSAINCSHMVEHLTREQAVLFFKECLRVLKPNGRIRIAVPDAHMIMMEYAKKHSELEYDDNYGDLYRHKIYNEGAEKATDDTEIVYHMLLGGGHQTIYNDIALERLIVDAGFFGATYGNFDNFPHTPLIEKVGWDMYPEVSLYVEGWKAGDDKSGNVSGDAAANITKFSDNHTVKVKLTEKDLTEAGMNKSEIAQFTKETKVNQENLYDDEKEDPDYERRMFKRDAIQAGATEPKKEINKICLIAPPFIPVNPDKYGGLERVVSSLGQGLASRGYDVTVIAPTDSTVKGCKMFLTGKPTGMQVNWLEAEQSQSMTYKEFLEKERFDIIHDHTWFSRVYGLKKIKPDIKICHTHHGHLNPQWLQYVRQFTNTPNLIAISNWMKKLWLAQYQVFAKTAYNGVDTDLYRYDPTIAVQNRLLFVGRVDKLKRPDVALDVAEKAGLPIDIVGSIDWSANKEYAEQVLSRAEKMGCNVYKDAPTDLKIKLMQQAKAVLVPSMFGEPFGLVVAESMSCGAPVLALDDGGISEITSKMGYGYTCDNPNEMIEVLKTMEDTDYNRSGRAEYIKYYFSLENLANRHVELYNEIVRGNEW